MESFIVYVWRGTRNVSIVATEEKDHVEELRKWAEALGYRVEVTTLGVRRSGSEHQ